MRNDSVTILDQEIYKFFKEKREYLNDIGNINYVEDVKQSKFITFSNIFCDNIIVKKKTNLNKDTDISLAACYAIIKKIFNNLKFKDYHIQNLNSIYDKNESPIQIYLVFKISFSEYNLDKILPFITTFISCCKKYNIYLDNIDISMDIKNISTRNIIQDYILSQGIQIKDIINDTSKVGINCISFNKYLNNKIKIKIKLYNKLVQMLQSSNVRKNFGCQITNLIYNTDYFIHKLQNSKNNGLTRFEITIYDNELHSYNYYENILNEEYNFIKNCPAYKVSFRSQWKKILSHISSSIMVYCESSKIFAYCHWWDSITGKIYGIIKKNIDSSTSQKLVANFSFNQRPIHYFILHNKSLHDYTYYEYKRTYDTITLFPGKSKGMFPSVESHMNENNKPLLKLSDLGMKEYFNIKFNWPEKIYNKNSKPLTKLDLIKKNSSNINMNNNNIQEIDIIRVSQYKRPYDELEVGKNYSVREFGYEHYRNKNKPKYLFIITTCNKKLRCGDKLRNTIEPSLKIKPIQNIQFKIINKTIKDGYFDVECELI